MVAGLNAVLMCSSVLKVLLTEVHFARQLVMNERFVDLRQQEWLLQVWLALTAAVIVTTLL